MFLTYSNIVFFLNGVFLEEVLNLKSKQKRTLSIDFKFNEIPFQIIFDTKGRNKYSSYRAHLVQKEFWSHAVTIDKSKSSLNSLPNYFCNMLEQINYKSLSSLFEVLEKNLSSENFLPKNQESTNSIFSALAQNLPAIPALPSPTEEWLTATFKLIKENDAWVLLVIHPKGQEGIVQCLGNALLDQGFAVDFTSATYKGLSTIKVRGLPYENPEKTVEQIKKFYEYIESFQKNKAGA